VKPWIELAVQVSTGGSILSKLTNEGGADKAPPLHFQKRS
jgi:hypothetical protein